MDSVGDLVVMLLGFLVPFGPPVLAGVLSARRSRTQSRSDRERGLLTRRPLFVFGLALAVWISILAVAIIVVFVLEARNTHELALEPLIGVIVMAALLLVVAGVFVGLGRQRLHVWGERIEFRPPWGRAVRIDAEDAVGSSFYVKTTDGGRGVTSYRVHDRHGHRAGWGDESVFPARLKNTIDYFAVRNHLEDGTSPPATWQLSGPAMPQFVTAPLQMPDGELAQWHDERTIMLDVVAAPVRGADSADLARTAEQVLPPDATVLDRHGALYARLTDRGDHGRDRVREVYEQLAAALDPQVQHAGIRERWSLAR